MGCADGLVGLRLLSLSDSFKLVDSFVGVIEVESDGVKSEGFFVELELELLKGGLELL
jgi:hypothetical protein